MGIEIHKFGSLASIGISETGEIWELGGDIPYPDDNAVTSLLSSSTQDAVGGTGIESMFVQGIVRTGGRFLQLTEPVIPTGQSLVTLQNEFWRVYRGWGEDIDSGVVNIGDIDIKHGATVLARISADEGQTLMAAYTVPEIERRGIHLTGWHFSVSKGGNAAGVQCTLYTREFGKSWRVRDREGITSNSGPFEVRWKSGKYLPPGSDIRIRVTDNTAVGTAVHGGFWMER